MQTHTETMRRSARPAHAEAGVINCYAFAAVPPFVQGLVRDLRVRWALEEAELPYRITLIGEREGAMPRSDYDAIQPFGQVPAIEDGDLALFESGAIVLYIAERSETLLPRDPALRACVVQWAFAALNTIEIPVGMLAEIDLFHRDERWAMERRPPVLARVRQRLAQLTACLEDRDHLTGEFSAADILMSTVLRVLRHTDLLEEQPTLLAYKQRCEARPAFIKALADQMAAFD